jgi:hypothetical protein
LESTVEQDPEIKSVYDPVLRAAPDPYLREPGPNPDLDRIGTQEVYSNEANRETCKNESFADDANNFTVLSFDSLNRLKQILQNFRVLSGLSCNLEKTCVMRIGNLEGDIPEDIRDLGFSFVDEMVLLGFTLSNGNNLSELNFNPIVEKIQNSIRYWERFFLSIPGKITVYKCLLLSQISYKASILMPNRDTIRTLSDLMENFVIKGITFAKDRIYRPVREGGLGLIPLDQYIKGLHCSWFKRAHHCMNDNWKYDLYHAGRGNVLSVKKGYLATEVGTVLSGLIDSFTDFQTKYTQYGNNFMVVPVLNNANFGYGRNQSIKLDAQFFGEENFRTHFQTISKLSWIDCTVNGSFISIRYFNEHTGIPFTREQYYDMKTAYTRARKKYHKDGAEHMKETDFLGSFKKGSKKFRRILGYELKEYDILKLTQVNTMARITNTTVPGSERVKNMYSMWGRQYLTNDLRIFLLKYYNNILGLGNRIAHFVPNAENRCTFCILVNTPDPVPESFEHLFFSCPVSQDVIRKFFQKYIVNELTAELYFTGSGLIGNEKENVPFSLSLDILRYVIWQCKLNKRIPTLSHVSEEVNYTINVVRTSNREISELFENCNMFTRRNEPAVHGGDGGDGQDGHGRG